MNIKNIINEIVNQFIISETIANKRFLNEDFNSEINKLKKFGYVLIEKREVNNYILFLVKEPEEGAYEIGITSNNKDFTTQSSQQKIRGGGDGKEFSIAKGFRLVISDWLNKYNPIYVGSLNKNKTNKYHNIISRLGFNVGQIDYDKPVIVDGSEVFPESWNFIISENNLKEDYLTEAKDSKNRSKARKYLRQVGYDDNKINDIEKSLINDLSPFIRDSEFKFMLAAARFFHERKLGSADDIRKLKQLIKLINSGHINEYDNNLNGEDFNTLYKKFETAIVQDFEKDKQALASKQYSGKSDYKVVRIDSYDEAKPYSKYNKWCVTQSQQAYDNYTGGLGTFYFMLRHDFKDIKQEQGNNTPKDDYGLSMIAVSVDGLGKLNTSTTRWNHSCGGTDNMFTTEELSNLMGQNFYQVFKPKFTKEEVIQKIKEGGELIEIGGLDFIEYNNKYYLIKDGVIDLNNSFDEVLEFYDGFVGVGVDSKGYNFINNDGDILSPNLWFNEVGEFNDGLAEVELNGKLNFINTKGELLFSNLWFDEVYNFYDGFAWVKISNNDYYYINAKGEIFDEDRKTKIDPNTLKENVSKTMAIIKEEVDRFNEQYFLGYHSTRRNLKDGYYKGDVLNVNDYDDVIRNVYYEIISDSDENIENDDTQAMNDVFNEKGYGFTYVSDEPIMATSFQSGKYKYGDNLFRVYGDGDEILLDDYNELNANIVVSKTPLYFKRVD